MHTSLCYAGVPLISASGFVLGNPCVVGMEDRTFTDAELSFLRAQAALAVARREERRVKA